MRRRREPQRQGEQHNPRPPFSRRTLQGMRHPNGQVDRRENAERRQNLVIRGGRRPHYLRHKAVQRQRNVPPCVAEQPPRHPPQARAQRQSGQHERQPQQQPDLPRLVAHVPHRGRARLPPQNSLQRQRQAGRPVRQCAVVDIAAGCEIASQGRRPLPHLTTASRKLVVRFGKLPPRAHPQTLAQQHQQQHRCDLLWALKPKFPQLVGRPPSSHQDLCKCTEARTTA